MKKLNIPAFVRKLRRRAGGMSILHRPERQER